MSDSEIFNALAGKTFYTPSAQSPAYSTTQFFENGSTLNFGLNTIDDGSGWSGSWCVEKNGIAFNETSNPEIYNQKFVQVTNGVYANIVTDQNTYQNPGPSCGFYIDSSSYVGQGLKAFYDRYDYVNWTTQSRPDVNGIYYLY